METLVLKTFVVYCLCIFHFSAFPFLVFSFICPANCSGRGVCDHSGDFPKCKCFDTNDQSPSCDGQNVENKITLSPSTSPSSSPVTLRSSSPTVMLSETPNVFVQISTENPVVTSLNPADVGTDISDESASPSNEIVSDPTTTVPATAAPTDAPITQSKFIDTGVDLTSSGISLQSFYLIPFVLSLTMIILT